MLDWRVNTLFFRINPALKFRDGGLGTLNALRGRSHSLFAFVEFLLCSLLFTSCLADHLFLGFDLGHHLFHFLLSRGQRLLAIAFKRVVNITKGQDDLVKLDTMVRNVLEKVSMERELDTLRGEVSKMMGVPVTPIGRLVKGSKLKIKDHVGRPHLDVGLDDLRAAFTSQGL